MFNHYIKLLTEALNSSTSTAERPKSVTSQVKTPINTHPVGFRKKCTLCLLQISLIIFYYQTRKQLFNKYSFLEIVSIRKS